MSLMKCTVSTKCSVSDKHTVSNDHTVSNNSLSPEGPYIHVITCYFKAIIAGLFLNPTALLLFFVFFRMKQSKKAWLCLTRADKAADDQVSALHCKILNYSFSCIGYLLFNYCGDS